MSFQAQTAAYAVRDVPPLAKLLLLTLAKYAGPDSTCFPSQRQLMDDTGLSERTVRRLLGDLEDGGFITREIRRRKDGSRSSDLIELVFINRSVVPVATVSDDASTGQPDPTPRSHGPDQPVSVAPPGASLAGLTTFEPINQPVTEPITEPVTLFGEPSSPAVVSAARSKHRRIETSRAEQDRFDQFWAIYPRRVAKQPALAAFLKATRAGTDPDLIMAAASAYAGSRAGKDPERTAHAATWLNDERWTDEIDTSAPTAVGGRIGAMGGYSALDQALDGLDWQNAA